MMLDKCQALVHDKYGVGFHTCGRKAVLIVEDIDVAGWLRNGARTPMCKQHADAPKRKAERSARHKKQREEDAEIQREAEGLSRHLGVKVEAYYSEGRYHRSGIVAFDDLRYMRPKRKQLLTSVREDSCGGYPPCILAKGHLGDHVAGYDARKKVR